MACRSATAALDEQHASHISQGTAGTHRAMQKAADQRQREREREREREKKILRIILEWAESI